MLPVSLYAHKAWAALLLEHAPSNVMGIVDIKFKHIAPDLS
jgi:hypothetical protein